MEAERKKEKQPRQVSEKETPFNISERKSAAASEARENHPALMQLYTMFLPGAGAGSRGRPKFITDKYGNRVRSGQESKKEN